MRKHLWVGYVIAAICLYYAFRGISFRDLGHTLIHAKPQWILAALGIYSVAYFLRTQRWAVLLRPVKPIPGRELFWTMMIGFFANNILPLRMGELVRAHLCGTRFKISRTASLGSLLLERIGDTLSFLGIFLSVALIYPFPWFVEKGALLLAAACFLAIAVIILMMKHQSRFLGWMEKRGLPPRWEEKIRHTMHHFLHSVSGLTQPRYVAEAMGLSIPVWILEGTFLFLMAHALNVNLLYSQAFFLLFLLGLSVTLPQAPGYVGTMELAGVLALKWIGIPKDQALPVILAIHGTQFLYVATFGSLGLWKEGLSFHSMTSGVTKPSNA